MLFWRVSESVGHFLEAATAANSDSDEDAVEPKKQKVSKKATKVTLLTIKKSL